jgi:hypothetical protein
MTHSRNLSSVVTFVRTPLGHARTRSMFVNSVRSVGCVRCKTPKLLSTPETGCPDPVFSMMELDRRTLQPDTVKQMARTNPSRESRYFMFRPLFTARKITDIAVIEL